MAKKKKRLAMDADTLLHTFKLKKQFGGPFLEDWLQYTDKLSPFQQQLFDAIYENSLYRIAGWNEEELKVKFIGFLFFIADIEESGKISTFFERRLQAEWNDFELSVITDCMVATPYGLNTPKKPYFFLQEFKKQKGDIQDPEGQMLAAMLISQKKNNDKKVVYGAWLNGSIWFFTALHEQNYYSSNAYDTTNKKDLLQIIFILRHLKLLILNR